MREKPLRGDITAAVDLTTRSDPGAVEARVLITDVEIAFVFDESGELLHQEQAPDIWEAGTHSGVQVELVAISDLVDVSQDVPAETAPDSPASLVLGFTAGASRENATIEGAASELGEFQAQLFECVFDGTNALISRSREDGAIDTEPNRATLAVQIDEIRFESDTDSVVVPRAEIDGFKTINSSTDGPLTEPIVAIYTERDGRSVRLAVDLPSVRYMNLFARYLQTSPETAAEAGGGNDAQTESETAVDSGAELSDSADPRAETDTTGRLEETEMADASANWVLLVDDDAGDLEMTEMVLEEREGEFQFLTATSAAEGMNALKSNPVDCVVSDYDMPLVNGVEFLQQVRAEYPTLPFILFTGQGSEEVAKQAILSDVTDYVEKGVGTQQYDVLLSRIRKALR
jgi:CheY-like chemotaxis protein